MEFKKKFKEAQPETICETDSHFDKSNYIAWIDKEYAQLQAEKKELLEALEIFIEQNTHTFTSHDYEFPEHVMKAKSLIQKHKQ